MSDNEKLSKFIWASYRGQGMEDKHLAEICKSVESLETDKKSLTLDLGLANSQVNHKTVLLGSCENALSKRDIKIKSLENTFDKELKDHEDTIGQRDYWESKATELANDIGKALGFEVGEHSSANCPVQNAIDGVFEMDATLDEALTRS